MAATLLGSWTPGASGQPLDGPRPALWDTALTVRAGGGFQDNIGLAYQNPVGSSFLSAGLEALATRLALDGPELSFLLNGEHREFLADGPIRHERSLSSLAQVKLFPGDRWEASLAAQYLHLDDVMDVAFTETNRAAVRVKAHTLTARPGLRVDLGRDWWAAMELPLTRQYYAAPLDDTWEYGATVRLGRDYGHRSEASLSYEPLARVYDRARQVAANGVPVTNTRRAFLQHEVRLAWRHHWDAARRWRTTAKLGWRLNDDNGSGYFDYTKLFSALEARYRAPRWEIVAEVRAAHYAYPVQTVSDTDPRKRDRAAIGVTVRAERQLSRRLRLCAEFDHEQVFSNDRFETYSVNTVSGGVQWEF